MNESSARVLEEAVEAASLYTQAELDHFKLRLAKAITVWSARLLSAFVALLSLVLVLIFAGLAGGIFLQAYVDPALAYLIVGLVYAFLGLMFVAFRRRLLEPFILRSTLNEMFDEA